MTHNCKNIPEKNSLRMEVEGRSVTLCFSEDPNPKLSNQIRSVLIDSFWQKNCTADGTVELTA